MRRTLAAVLAAALTLSASPITHAAPTGSLGSLGAGSLGSLGSSGGYGDGTITDFAVTERGTFAGGWAMSLLPGTDKLFVTQKNGGLFLVDTATGERRAVSGGPQVRDVGQGGMHDIVPGPTFAQDGTVFLSWVRPHAAGAQGVVGRATLDADAATLSGLEVIWEQTPTTGDGHFALRLLATDEHLFVTSGDRQKMAPAQEMDTNLGKVLRLTHDGDPAPGNPWADSGGVAAQFWTIGHRNPLGIEQAPDGSIWLSEMGPQGGDELNLIVGGDNYGWPRASMGAHYGGGAIPDHRPGDGFHAPAQYWVPSISPGSLAIYRGDLFAGWQGSALLGGLSGQTLVRVALDGTSAEEAQAWNMGQRIREVAEGPDGAIWVLEDGGSGRLLELRPA